jgi:hypothetical protein
LNREKEVGHVFLVPSRSLSFFLWLPFPFFYLFQAVKESNIYVPKENEWPNRDIKLIYRRYFHSSAGFMTRNQTLTEEKEAECEREERNGKFMAKAICSFSHKNDLFCIFSD